MMQIREFSRLTGVSVRTLHYYDQIGLLRPARVDKDSGYRYYDEASLLRMQQILFYRELDFPLKDICRILSSPDYDSKQALAEQRQLLCLKKQRLERLIAAIDDHVKGEINMHAFDNREFDQYREEVKEKWGHTQAYAEYQQKNKQDYNALSAGMDAIMAEFAACKAQGHAPASKEAQVLVKKLQGYITEHFYNCTDAILAGLGEMYVADDRFRANIDRHGDGTAEFIRQAIANR
jgi:DNA-binding transcriptional MerR regulator